MTKDESLTVADLAKLGKLFEEHRPRLLRMVQRRIDPAMAVRIDPEEILSEAFLRARQKWAGFRTQSTMTSYAWLYRIALDCLIEAWRREVRARRDFRREMPWPERSSIQLALNLIVSSASPSDAAVREELRQHVCHMMDLLGERDREILWMRHFDQLSFKEAAAVLGIRENAANVRYVRALRRLRDLWLRVHPEKGTQT